MQLELEPSPNQSYKAFQDYLFLLHESYTMIKQWYIYKQFIEIYFRTILIWLNEYFVKEATS